MAQNLTLLEPNLYNTIRKYKTIKMLKKYEFTDREEFAKLYNSIGETEVKESVFDKEGNLIPTVLLEKTSHKPIILGYMEIGYNDVVKQIAETIQVVSLDEDEQEIYTDEAVLKDVTVREFIFSDKYCIDIFWKDYEDESVLSLYEVFPKHPKHMIA